MSSYLIVGLGNIGNEYKKTRHNVGFEVVSELAKKEGFLFKETKFKSFLAKGLIDGKKVFLAMPTTYMNNSGRALVLLKNFYKIESENMLVVTDDVNIDYGEFRLKEQGSSGGHNGLKSVEESLSSNKYPRLRIGVGDRKYQDLEAFVLSKFSIKEQEKLVNIKKEAIDIIYSWLKKGIVLSMTKSNRRKKIEEINGESRKAKE